MSVSSVLSVSFRAAAAWFALWFFVAGSKSALAAAGPYEVTWKADRFAAEYVRALALALSQQVHGSRAAHALRTGPSIEWTAGRYNDGSGSHTGTVDMSSFNGYASRLIIPVDCVTTSGTRVGVLLGQAQTTVYDGRISGSGAFSPHLVAGVYLHFQPFRTMFGEGDGPYVSAFAVTMLNVGRGMLCGPLVSSNRAIGRFTYSSVLPSLGLGYDRWLTRTLLFRPFVTVSGFDSSMESQEKAGFWAGSQIGGSTGGIRSARSIRHRLSDNVFITVGLYGRRDFLVFDRSQVVSLSAAMAYVSGSVPRASGATKEKHQARVEGVASVGVGASYEIGKSVSLGLKCEGVLAARGVSRSATLSARISW